jgi:hypothetical protein
MRNAISVQNFIVTIDNAGCIGEKELDEVQAPNPIVANFTARTALLEQWCAGAEPVQILISNFTGESAWQSYVDGINELFDQLNLPTPPITGSTETNFSSKQSGLSLTMLGTQNKIPNCSDCQFFVVGQPMIGPDILAYPTKVAQLHELYPLLKEDFIQAIWPTGSKGIGAELDRFVGHNWTCEIDVQCSAGPSSVVIIAVKPKDVEYVITHISSPITEVKKSFQ